MEQAFLLPVPKSFEAANAFETETNQKIDRQKLAEANERLNCLAKDQSLWPSFQQKLKNILPCQYDLIQMSQTSDQQNLLHLAVLADQLECVSFLSKDPSLLEKRNRLGLTPVDLALYLHKPQIYASLMHFSMNRDFFAQPQVEIQADSAIELDYLPQPIFESSEILEEILTYTQKAKSEDNISNERIWMGVYYDKEIQRGLHPRVAIRRIDQEIGYGVFALERILPCSFLGEYSGLIQTRRREHILRSDYCIRYTSWTMGKRAYVIDAENFGNFTRFFNHSDHPNASLVCVYWRGMPRLIFVSLQEIKEGTQITFDYGSIFWKQTHALKRNL